MDKLYIGKEYLVKPSSIRFDQDMVEFNRVHNDEEYTATKLSIKKSGQHHPICINDQTGLCEDGRHRVKACLELGIEVKCTHVDGSASKEDRLDLYNLDLMSGRDLNTAQKAVQAHKYTVLTGTKLEDSAKRFKTNQRAVTAVSTIVGLGQQDVITQLAQNGYWTNPTDNKKIRDVRRIATILKQACELIEETETQETVINYTEMINTEKGKEEFWRLRTLTSMSQHELQLLLVEHMNMKYKLKIDMATGEINETND